MKTSMWQSATERLQHVKRVAEKSGLEYVVCFQIGPIAGELNSRVGYFEASAEASMFAEQLRDCYENKFPSEFLMYSSVPSFNNIGNLRF